MNKNIEKNVIYIIIIIYICINININTYNKMKKNCRPATGVLEGAEREKEAVSSKFCLKRHCCESSKN